MGKKTENTEKQKNITKEEIEEPVKNEETVPDETEEKEIEEQEQEVAVEEQEPTTEEKLAELQDRYLRLSAEFDNFRKRTLKEKIEIVKTANEELLGSILPVMDDFERAIHSVEEANDIVAVKEGLNLIFGKFSSFLKQQGIKEIDSLHKEFDTDLHEAVTKIPAPEKKLRGKVVDVIQKGYFLNDKVIRYSKVVVGE